MVHLLPSLTTMWTLILAWTGKRHSQLSLSRLCCEWERRIPWENKTGDYLTLRPHCNAIWIMLSNVASCVNEWPVNSGRCFQLRQGKRWYNFHNRISSPALGPLSRQSSGFVQLSHQCRCQVCISRTDSPSISCTRSCDLPCDMSFVIATPEITLQQYSWHTILTMFCENDGFE